MVISSQALNILGKVQRLSLTGVHCESSGSALLLWCKSKEDDIVHAIWKQVDKCNQLVVGSNPTPGAIRQAHGLCGQTKIMWYVYIFFCDQKTFYVGSTDNLERRLQQHIRKESFYTKKFSDIKLVYKESYFTRGEAMRREEQIKRWSIAKKKALITGDIKSLRKLSKGRGRVE